MNEAELERRLARALGQVDAEFLRRLLDYLGWPPDLSAVPDEYWQEYAAALNRVLSNHTQDAALGWLREWMDEHQPGFDWNAVVADAAAWSASVVASIVTGIVDNTRRTVERVVADAQESGYTPDDLAQRLAHRYGPVHAEMVAITETTRALGWAASELQDVLAQMGLHTVRRWLTAEDEKVCPVCAPLDHTTRESGAWAEAGFPGGPPAHPRCRCRVAVEYTEPLA